MRKGFTVMAEVLQQDECGIKMKIQMCHICSTSTLGATSAPMIMNVSLAQSQGVAKNVS
jgi:hypothetical protein